MHESYPSAWYAVYEGPRLILMPGIGIVQLQAAKSSRTFKCHLCGQLRDAHLMQMHYTCAHENEAITPILQEFSLPAEEK